MKICAIRAAELGPFATAVAVEGLGPGLNLLPGPNELGKSSLFKALHHVLTTDYKSSKQQLHELGSSPLVEAEFEIGQQRYTVRKRFLAQAAAELRDHASGRVWRGADAENRLGELLALAHVARFRELVWVAQTHSFRLPDKKEAADLAPALLSLVEAETAGAAGEGIVRQVAQLASRRRADLVTAKTAKATGELKVARVRAEELRARHAAALAKAQNAQEKFAERLRLETQRNAVLATLPSLAEAAERLQQRLANVQRDRERLQNMLLKEQAANAEAKRAGAALADFDKAVADEARLASESAALATEREASATELARLDALIHETEPVLADLDAARADTARAIDAARRREQACAARAEAAARTARVAQARRLDEDRGAALKRAADLAVDAADLARIEKLEADCVRLEARTAAAAVTADIAYEPGAATRILRDGEVLADGASWRLDRPMVLTIPGVGTLRLTPPADAQRDAEALATARDALAAGLAAYACAAVAELRERQREAVVAGQDARALDARLAELAPEGLDALAAAVAAGPAQSPADDDGPEPERLRADWEAHAAALAQQRAEAEQRLRETMKARTEAAGRLAGVENRLARLTGERNGLAATIPAQHDRAALRDRLATAATNAASALATATRERLAVECDVPDETATMELARNAEAARRALAEAEAGRTRLQSAIAEVNGFLSRHAEEGVEASVEDLADELARAEAHERDLTEEAEALALLGGLLDAAQERRRQALFAPVIARLTSMLDEVVPGLSFGFQGPLVTSPEVVRAGRTLSAQALSDGTREQIAVLVRLAYAGLLADQGRPLPVILDDALVYSDDARLAAMVGVLARAAAHHQVIVLTCHETAFAPLVARHGATRLALTAWSADLARERARLA